jgi:hypothetical protein
MTLYAIKKRNRTVRGPDRLKGKQPPAPPAAEPGIAPAPEPPPKTKGGGSRK